NTTAMAGNLIARAIVENDQTWRQFTPFELVWAGGILGRAAVQAYYWIKRVRGALAERRAQAVAPAARSGRAGSAGGLRAAAAAASLHDRQRFEQVHVLLVLDQR